MPISIISASTGNGHNAVMNALKHEFEKKECSIRCHPNFYEDLMPSNRVLSSFYNSLLMASVPLAVKYTELAILQGEAWQNESYKNCYNVIEAFFKKERSTAIISTTPLLNKLVLRYMEENKLIGKIPFYTVVTDLYNPIYSGFEAQGADAYFVPNSIVRKILLKSGIEENKIKIFGFPCLDKFNKKPSLEAKNQIFKKYGLDPKRHVLLINSGAKGSQHYLEIFKSILSDSQPNMQIVFICGNNTGLLKLAQFFASKENRKDAIVLPYVENMEELLSISDACITKAGANTVYECLLSGTALIIDATNGLLYQEKGAVEFIKSNRAGYILNNIQQIKEILNDLYNEASIEHIKENISMMGLENGASKIVNYILEDISSKNKGEAYEVTRDKWVGNKSNSIGCA